MTKYLEVYLCELCGNIVEVLEGEGAPLVCCGQDMTLQEEQTADTSKEKHVPFISEAPSGYTVKVGELQNHPMLDAHLIQWIELMVGNKVYRQMLCPGDAPEASFCVEKSDTVSAREYCNLHGLWKG